MRKRAKEADILGKTISSPEDLMDVVKRIDRDGSPVKLLLLDHKQKITRVKDLRYAISPYSVMRAVSLFGCSDVIVVEWRRRGAVPSPKDFWYVRRLWDVLDGLGVSLVDFAVVAGEEFFSLRDMVRTSPTYHWSD